MPRSSLPPTPASSTDIPGKEGPRLSATEKMSFALPPPAIAAARSNGGSSNSQVSKSKLSNSGYSLPPPPTRNRKIIQMKPKPQQTEETCSSTVQTSSKGNKKGGDVSYVASTSTGKKQPSSTSVAGKKIARKTAHSVIERRRRSKMNEEFGVLKDMIPACKDQEMHKLAILQASIEYLRYLEQCINNLKAANNSVTNQFTRPQALPSCPDNSFPDQDEENNDDDDNDNDNDNDSDLDMEMENHGSTSTSPAFHPVTPYHQHSYTSPQSITPSPALDPTLPLHHQATSSYTSSISTLPSPAFGPQQHPHLQHHSSLQNHTHTSQYAYSTSASPTLFPQASVQDPDQEATAALLMLNKDRRNPSNSSGRSMSVKDLLSF